MPSLGTLFPLILLLLAASFSLHAQERSARSSPPSIASLAGAMDDRIKKIDSLLEELRSIQDRYESGAPVREIDSERDRIRREIEDLIIDYRADLEQLMTRSRALVVGRGIELFGLGLGQGGLPDDTGDRLADAMSLEDHRRRLKTDLRRIDVVLARETGQYRLAVERDRAAETETVWLVSGVLVFAALSLAGGWYWKMRLASEEGPTPLKELARAGTAPGEGPIIGALVGGQFRIDSELARGGMGVVYYATDTRLDRPVAVKRLRAELHRSEREVEMLLAEARLVSALDHPGIVKIHDILREAGEIFLVFEYVDGRPLSSLLEQYKRLTLRSTIALARQVAEAIDFAHSKRVIHRDLKPSNIMVDAHAKAKVMDFGIAHQAKQTVARVTKAAAWGTPAYMAPEQEMGSVSRASDLYSMAVCFYEVLTGVLPFQGPNFLVQKRENRYPPPSRAAKDIPPGADGVFAKALSSDPAKRYRDGAAFSRALAGLAEKRLS